MASSFPAQHGVLARIHRCGLWEIDLTRRELRRDGAPVAVGGRAFDILEVLLLAAGALVTKHDLMDRVWPGVFVGESALHVHVWAIRKVLGSDRDQLKTVFGRGYRLLGCWTTADATPDRDDRHTPFRSPMQEIAAGERL